MHRSSAAIPSPSLRPSRIARLTARSLECDPRLDQVVETLRREGRQPDTLVRLIDDDTLALEDAERLAHWHSADAELLRELQFDDSITRKEPASRGRRHGGVDHHVDERARAKRLPHLVRWHPGGLLCAGKEGSYGRLVRMRITPLDRPEDRIPSYEKQNKKSEDGVEVAEQEPNPLRDRLR